MLRDVADPDAGRLDPAIGPASPRPLRIAFLSYRSDPRVGGQGIFVAAAAVALARRGHAVDVLSGPPYPVLPAGVRLVRIPSLDLYAQPHNGHRALRPRHLTSVTDLAEYLGHLSGKFMEPWAFGRRVARHLRARRSDYDVVLDNQTLASGLAAIERAGLPVVGVIHHPIHRDREFALAAEPDRGMRFLVRRWYSFLPMQERAARRLRRIVVVSAASAADVAACFGVPRTRIAVVPLGVDRATFRPRPDLARDPATIVTTASADVPLKGLRYLLDAYATLRATRPDVRLTVIGRLRAGATSDLIDRLGLRAHVAFVHDLPQERLAETFARATICVTPSLYEGFGLPAAEAMACGTPVVVTDGGALPEVVGDAGVVVPRADAAALAHAIAALLDDPAARARASAAGLARVERLFCWDRFAAAYEPILREAARC